MDSFVSIGWDCLNCVVAPIVPPIKRGFGYVIYSNKWYADNLQKEVGKLKFEAQRIRSDAEAAKQNNQEIHEWVPKFLASAEKLSQEAGGLLEKFKNESKTCCHGTLPNPKWRFQFNRNANQKADDIKNLILEIREEISFSGPPSGKVTSPPLAGREGKDAVQSTASVASASSASTSMKDVFESRDSMIRNIMDTLADNRFSVVGVHGMGGVGKSTLLADAEKRIREKKLFDWVAKADVSKNPDIKMIQDDIALELGLAAIKKEEKVNLRAKLLHTRLENERKEKKVLIILDNLWEPLDLKLIGIPCGLDNKVIGCKLLLTSRYENVLKREMGCDRDFRLCELPEDEARGLFEKIVGHEVHDDEFKPWVERALRKCAGVPFLIVAIAKRLINAKLYEWKDTVRKFEKFEDKNINLLIDDTLKWSYEKLEDEVKSILQLCVVYGIPNPSLEDLLRYGVGLGLFPGVSNLEEARDRLSSHIRTLQASSLLLDSEDVDGFKIHDLVCEFVTRFVSSDHPRLLLKDENILATQLQEESLKSCTAICFPYINTKELPEELDCPNLRTFLLFTNNSSLEVPDSFFNSMKKLAVLHLTSIRLTRSPMPFQFLVNLHTLSLEGCSLEDVAILGKLKGLQVLSLASSNIQQLPKEIGQLVELRLLDLSNCSELQMIEKGVLGSLINLEELYMEDSFDQWSAVDQASTTNASLIELNHMKNLCTLHVCICDSSVIPRDLKFEKLTKYKIRIGRLDRFKLWKWSINYKGSRTLEIKLNPESDILQRECIRTTLDVVDDLWMDGLNGVEQSICQLSLEGFPQLKRLHVQNSPYIRFILKGFSLPAFKSLELLYLESLINLEKLCHGSISSQSFSALKVVRVKACHKTEVLFSLSVLRELPQLEKLKVEDCKLMRGIVESDDRGKVELHNLHVLKLRDLPNIKSFIANGTAPSSSSTSGDQVGRAFFNGQQVSIPSLESLEMVGLPNLKEIWSDESPLELSNLRSLEVMRCESLLKVFRSRLSVQLLKLHTLIVKDCASLQEIFDVDGPSGSRDVDILLELTTLELDGLQSSRSLTQLRDLVIRGCDKMEVVILEEEELGVQIPKALTFLMLTNLELCGLKSLTCFSREKCSHGARNQDCTQSCSTTLFNRKVSMPSLESLTMEGLPNLKEIWSDESPLESSNLQSLEVVSCESLLKVINSRSLIKLHKLHTLIVKDCVSTQEIFDLNGPSNNVDTLSKLTTLELDGLQSLRHVWNKDPSGIVSCHNLKTLELNDCDNLEFLFFPSMIKSLAKLSDLTISSCKKMEVVIMEEEGLAMKTSETLSFPMLTNLRLGQLESLTCFSCGTSAREARSQDHVQSRSNALFNGEVAFSRLETLDIRNMDNPEFLFPRSMVKSLAQLKKLSISSCEKMEAIIMEEEGLGMATPETLAFPMLTDLSLSWLGSLTCFSRGKCSQEAQNQGNVQSRSIGLFHGEVSMPSLESLTMEGLPNPKEIWSDESPLESSNLQFLEVVSCESLLKVINSRSLIKLHKLHTLIVKDCVSTQEIFYLNGPSNNGNVDILSKLTTLELNGLQSLRHVWNKDPSGIVSCHNLTKLELNDHDNLEFLFFPSMVKSLANLSDLTILNCKKMEVVITEEEGLAMETSETPTFPMLTNLRLKRLKSLTCFSCGTSAREARSQDHVQSRSIAFFNGEVAFPRLETLDISNMDNPEFLFPQSVVKSLTQLKKRSISSCEKMEAIIMEAEGLGMATPETLAFPMLTDLSLSWLGSLTCFSRGSQEAQNQDHVQSCSIGLFHGEVAFPRLEKLDISYMNNQEFLFPPSMVKSLIQLKELNISFCEKMEAIIMEEEELGTAISETVAFPMLTDLKLNHLGSLTCFSCGKRSQEAQNQDHVQSRSIALFHGEVQFPQLAQMALSHMGNLRKIWTDDPQESLTFDCLIEVKIQNCRSLEHLFPHWVATSLTQLQNLRVDSCGIEEIVTSGDDAPHSDAAQVLFPELNSLILHDMSRLKSFCPNLPTWSWPLLEELRVTHCDEMNMLSFAPSMNKWTQKNDQRDLLDQEARSSFERDFPNLKRLCLVGKDVQMLQDGKFPSDIFSKTEALTLACFHDGNIVFPPRFLLERFQNLQSLEVLCSSFEDIFPDEGLVAEEKHPVLENLRELKLSKLHNLKRVWRENYLMENILQRIDRFEVEDCPDLTIIFPPMASFRNLTRLVVKNSSRLIHLVTTSAITNLLHLTHMTIIGCEKLKEVVTNDGNGEGIVVSLGQLRWLTLQNLPSLLCFSAGTSCSFRFPSLWGITVEECPQMKFFSKGTLSTPELKIGSLLRYKLPYSSERDWEGDLNRIIQKLSA